MIITRSFWISGLLVGLTTMAFAQTAPNLSPVAVHSFPGNSSNYIFQEDLEITPDGSLVLESGAYSGSILNTSLPSSYYHQGMHIILSNSTDLQSPVGWQFGIPGTPAPSFAWRSISNLESHIDSTNNLHVYYAGHTRQSISDMNILAPYLPSATTNVSVTVTSQYRPVIFIAKTSVNGGFQWVIQSQTNNPNTCTTTGGGPFGGSSTTCQTQFVELNDMVVDENGNTFVVGKTPLLNPAAGGNVTLGGVTISDANGNNYFVAKINPLGVIDWVHVGSALRAKRVGIFDPGSIIVSGETTPALFPSPNLPSQPPFYGGQDVFLAYIDRLQGVLQWVTVMGGATDDRVIDLAVRPGSVQYLAMNVDPTIQPMNTVTLSDPNWYGSSLVQEFFPLNVRGSIVISASVNVINNRFPLSYTPNGTDYLQIRSLDITHCGDLMMAMDFSLPSLTLPGLQNFGVVLNGTLPVDGDVIVAKYSETLAGISGIQLGTPAWREYATRIKVHPVSDDVYLLGNTATNPAGDILTFTGRLLDNDPVNNTCP